MEKNRKNTEDEITWKDVLVVALMFFVILGFALVMMVLYGGK